MSMKVTAVKCYCTTNPDFCCAYNADDVKENIEELEIPDSEWMEYLLGRIFLDCDEWTTELQNVVVSDVVNEITVTLGNDKVTIKKFYGTRF